MSELFISILNMNLISSYVIIFIMLIRIPLRKAPKAISYALWTVVAFRLILPFSFESRISLIPSNMSTNPIPRDIIYQQSPQINSGIETVDSLINQSLPAPSPGASANPLQIYVEIGAYVWILGMAILFIYSLASILLLKKKLKKAELLKENIYQAENLRTPFVLGLIRPKIYLPAELKSAERSYILLHEQTHIARKDHLIKILAFFILSIHWFNPLVWFAFVLMSRDMELSCDERVLKEMDDIKKPYASSLLSLAVGGHVLNGSPLAFGEGNIKGRIKNVMNYKKPKFWVIIVSVFVLIGLAIALLANPSNSGNSNQFTEDEIAEARAVVEEYFTAIKDKDKDLILKTMTSDHSEPNVVLYGEEIRTLLSINYIEDDSERKQYVTLGRGTTNASKIENVIVFTVDFNIRYPQGAIKSPWNEGDYNNWKMILIREDKESDWLIDDQGYQ